MSSFGIALGLSSLLAMTNAAAPPKPVQPTPPPAAQPNDIPIPGKDNPPAQDARDLLPPEGASTGAFESAVSEARKLLDAGDAAAAATKYEEAVRARPDSAEATYNLGVARYREGKFNEASQAFARAAALASKGESTNAKLTADSLYNRAAGFFGSTREQAEAAQKALKSREKASPDQPTPNLDQVDPEALKQAIKDARASFQGFKDAATADPNDRDSRANAEQSNRLVKALEELQKMQQQQQQQQNQQQNKDQQKQDKQDKQDQQDKQQQQNQQQKDQQDKQDQQQDQQQQQQQQQQQEQDKQKQGDPSDDQQDQQEKEKQEQQKKEQEQKEKEKKDKEGKGDQEKQEKKDQQKQGSGEESKDNPEDKNKDQEGKPKEGPQEMTHDEADRLLQAVRDAEKKRRAQLEAREAQRQSRTKPPAKDW